MTDSEKLEALYRLYEKPLYHIAMAVLHHHEQAEDAVHDAFCTSQRATNHNRFQSAEMKYQRAGSLSAACSFYALPHPRPAP